MPTNKAVLRSAFMKGCQNFMAGKTIQSGLAQVETFTSPQRKAFILGHNHMKQLLSTEFDALQMAPNITFDPKLSAANVEYEVGR